MKIISEKKVLSSVNVLSRYLENRRFNIHGVIEQTANDNENDLIDAVSRLDSYSGRS